jgi:hypothetical protein
MAIEISRVSISDPATTALFVINCIVGKYSFVLNEVLNQLNFIYIC